MSAGLKAWGEANREVQAACQLLIDPSPENLARCSAALTGAISCITGTNPALAEAMTLHASVERARQLLESAANFHHGWQRILRALAASGYNATGTLTPLCTQGRFFLQG